MVTSLSSSRTVIRLASPLAAVSCRRHRVRHSAPLLSRRSDPSRARAAGCVEGRAARYRLDVRDDLQPVRHARLQADGHARAEHQHHRRGARFELVHQSDRHSPGHRRRDCAWSQRRHSARPFALDTDPEKTAGAHPGFTAKDASGETWFLEFDPPPIRRAPPVQWPSPRRSSGRSATTRWSRF